MLFLIDTREPPPEPPAPRRRRGPRVRPWTAIRLVAAVALFVTGAILSGLAGLVLLLVALTLGCAVLADSVPYLGGLSEHRQ